LWWKDGRPEEIVADHPLVLLGLFIGAGVAGWVDAIAGGGGMLTIPLLLWAGLPPAAVLGTNKFQASFGSSTAAVYHVRKGVVSLREALPGIIWTAIGAALGAWSVQRIPSSALGAIIPGLLLAIAIYALVTPNLGERHSAPRMRVSLFYVTLGLSLGFYDGFFGPGVGSFWAIAFVILLGYVLTKATGYTKVMNFTSNIVSLVVFLIGGQVFFLPGIIMAAGQVVGSRIGSGMVLRRGARFIRPIFVTMVILTTLKLIAGRYF
jgi:uncharacterized membrane protein YfcA